MLKLLFLTDSYSALMYSRSELSAHFSSALIGVELTVRSYCFSATLGVFSGHRSLESTELGSQLMIGLATTGTFVSLVFLCSVV